MKMANWTAAAAVCLTAFAGQSWAGETTLAQAGSVNGQVAITRDGQTLPLTSTTTLQAGDRLVALENGQAKIRFADGCTLQIQPKSVATIGAQSPCGAAHLVNHSTPMDFADGDSWGVPLAIVGFAAAFGLVVATEKSNHQFTVAAPISP